jgi:drug/metabolite transporter (DMT)-like permease
MPLLLSSTQALLNNIGLEILDLVDSLILGVASAILFALMYVISFAYKRRMPKRDEAIKCVLGIAALATVIPIFCIFLLTDPPSVGKLPRDTRWIIGLIASVLFLYEGFSMIKSVFFKKP